jgi:hypothetical protein
VALTSSLRPARRRRDGVGNTNRLQARPLQPPLQQRRKNPPTLGSHRDGAPLRDLGTVAWQQPPSLSVSMMPRASCEKHGLVRWSDTTGSKRQKRLLQNRPPVIAVVLPAASSLVVPLELLLFALPRRTADTPNRYSHCGIGTSGMLAMP